MNAKTLTTIYQTIPEGARKAWLRRHHEDNASGLEWLRGTIAADYPDLASELGIPLPGGPRTFSKLRLVVALMDAGLWPTVKQWIEDQGLMDLYLAAQTFREDDPRFTPALAALKGQLGVSDEQAEAILEAASI